MKRITCEMCGSTDLIKQDGVFVCQSCGTKYSVEEAKKMMMEVTGTVNVANVAQTENLLQLAKQSYDSKNYVKAEDFCNQVLAIDNINYEAWQLKGSSIMFQISTTDPRSEEAINCLIMAYNVIRGTEIEEEKRNEIFTNINSFLVLNVNFHLSMMEEQRPENNIIDKIKSSFLNSCNKLYDISKKMNINEVRTSALFNKFVNVFIHLAVTNISTTWENVVYYNYARNKLVMGRWIDDNYRPTSDIFNTYLDETANLIDLLYFCEQQFNEDTPAEDKLQVYSNLKTIWSTMKDAECYDLMETTYTNGYGAVMSQRQYWKKTGYVKNKHKTIILEKISYIVDNENKCKQEIATEEKAKKLERIKQYWNEHADEMKALKKEMDELKVKYKAFEEQSKVKVSELEEKIEEIQKRIEILTTEKNSLGMFKKKEKKELRDKINETDHQLRIARHDLEEEKKQFKASVVHINRRMSEIQKELTKDR